jgi:hypothetical protein
MGEQSLTGLRKSVNEFTGDRENLQFWVAEVVKDAARS